MRGFPHKDFLKMQKASVQATFQFSCNGFSNALVVASRIVKAVSAIEYTTYEEMALEKMHEIREDIFAKYPLSCMHVYHSLGIVATGEISLFVFTSSAHRKAAIDACEEAVERIKAELPVWGKELFDNATYQWKENK
jgi:molybdopterin synthase catalytic subunit